MNKEIKERWVKALRSGSYSQGTGRLRKTRPTGRPEYCCLGVLCQVEKVGKWVKDEKIDDDWVLALNKNYDMDEGWIDGELSGDLLSEFGLSQKQQTTLIVMNDDQGRNFKEIADWVEENL